MAQVAKQNRFTSKVFWLGVVSILALTLKTFGVYEIDDTLLSGLVDSVFAIIGLFAVGNNPTNPKGF